MNESPDSSHARSITEVLLMRELGLSFTEINNLSIKKVSEYIIIIDEIHNIEKKQMEAAQK